MASSAMLLAKPFIGDPRVTREVRSLRGAGHDITVLSWNREGSIDRDYRESSGARVLMVGPRCPRRSLINFVLKLPLYWFACLCQSRRLDFSLVHAHDFDTLPIGALLSKLRGAHLLFDSHESYADMISQDVPKIIYRAVKRLERWFAGNCEFVVVADAATAPEIGVNNATVVLNCPGKEEMPEVDSNGRGAGDGRFTLGYFGTLENGRFVSEAIEAVSATQHWSMVIAGSGTLKGHVSSMAKESEAVEFLGQLSHEEVMRHSARCDALHVILDPTIKNYAIATPLRLFEAMSLGIPSIVTENTISSDLVRREDCGFICRYEIESLKELLKYISSHTSELVEKGRRGREAFYREYNWENQVSGLLKLYSDSIKGG